jgi:hypothetical protein
LKLLVSSQSKKKKKETEYYTKLEKKSKSNAAFAGLMFAVLQTPIYTVYSVSSHNDAGTYMLVTCLLLLLVGLPAYLIHRTLFHVRIKAMNNNNRLE